MPGEIDQLEFAFSAPIVIPRIDGSFLVRPGKPILRTPDISAEQASKILGCSVWSIYRYIRDGDIKDVRQVKRRGRVRLNREEIESLARKAHSSLIQ